MLMQQTVTKLEVICVEIVLFENLFVEHRSFFSKGCILTLKKKPPVLGIVLGLIGGIILFGLLLLVLLKLLVTAHVS